MGWFSNLLFGDSEHRDASGIVLPKSVEQWQSGGKSSSPAPVVQPQSTVASPAESPYRDGSGNKVIPEVDVSRVEPHLSSDQKHVEVWITVRNDSNLEIELTRIECLGRHVDPNRFLKAGESHELKAYAGDTPRDHSRHKAFVDYKIVGNGDYFRTEFVVEYHYERDEHGEFYIPEEFKRVGPVSDI